VGDGLSGVGKGVGDGVSAGAQGAGKTVNCKPCYGMIYPVYCNLF